jgi:protein-S-isoprenylcysteine O-methyltransferase Ste14
MPAATAPARAVALAGAETHIRQTVDERRLRRDPREVISKVVLAGLMLALAYRVALDYFATGRITGLLLLISELLVVVLTIARRGAIEVDRRWKTRIVTAISVAGPPLVRPALGFQLAPDALTAAVSACGLLFLIAGKLSLGRSFGLVPANRGIVRSGVYRLVRHPIYAGYLVSHAAFVAGHFSLWNDLALVSRAVYEEETLMRDAAYCDYSTTVRWRLLPGVF